MQLLLAGSLTCGICAQSAAIYKILVTKRNWALTSSGSFFPQRVYGFKFDLDECTMLSNTTFHEPVLHFGIY